VAHLSGDTSEADGSLVPRRRAFSLSFGMTGGGASQRSVVVRESSSLVLKSSSVFSVTSKHAHADDSAGMNAMWQPIAGQSTQ